MNELEAIGGEVVLLPGREKPVEHRHPWVFSGSVASVSGEPRAGDLVTVRSSKGTFLGRGFYAPDSAVRVRFLVFREEPVDENLFDVRIGDAVRRRESFKSERTDCYRLINAEGDDLPGLTVDNYAGHLSCQLLIRGLEKRIDWILASLEKHTGPKGITLKQVRESRGSEGLEMETATIRGEAPTSPVEIQENGLTYLSDIMRGQKTGFYLDQRENRARVRGVARGRRVLNCYSYSGGFTLAALAGGATRVISVDTSQPALNLAREVCQKGGFEIPESDFVRVDVVDYLRGTKDRFDLIVLDPPAFAKNRGMAQQAARAYKEINRLAMGLLAPGGLLLTCSCSRGMDRDLFHKVLFGAALDAGVTVRRIGEFGHPPDHPVSVYHPEGEYLKAILFTL